MVAERFPRVRLFTTEQNVGAEARNIGIANARGEIVVTIDDDIFGITGESIKAITRIFRVNNTLAALCFMVRDYYTGSICNWCHPYADEEYADRELVTTEITEGAVAFNKEAVVRVGMYPEKFIISHEGSDLAARIIDHQYDIRYSPQIVVRHKYARESRASWRRYYYDTRNAFWLAIRNYRLIFGVGYLTKRTVVMLIYSIRDGYFKYWLKAFRDSLADLPAMLRARKTISRETERKIREINRNRPGLVYYFKKRMLQKQVKI